MKTTNKTLRSRAIALANTLSLSENSTFGEAQSKAWEIVRKRNEAAIKANLTRKEAAAKIAAIKERQREAGRKAAATRKANKEQKS
jgi:hypothetical protein